MSKFQIILLFVFGFFILAGVAVFALYRGSSGGGDYTVVVWGDIPAHSMNSLLSSSYFTQDDSVSIKYQEKQSSSIEVEFTEALARGEGPDLVILSQDKIWKEKAKLTPIPYANLSEADFKATFVEEAELFLDQAGIYALPITIDPMVMYYNRDLLSSAGIANPITGWDEIYDAAGALSKRDGAGNLTNPVMALGESVNIPHAKSILSLLMLQSGTPITAIQGSLGLRSMISTSFGGPVVPGEAALNFYTQFSNPSRVYYSWNRSLIDAQTHFTSGDSAYYLGFASELSALRNKNPNLNIAVARVPQSNVSNNIITFGKVRGIAISRGSKSPGAAFAAAMKLVSAQSSSALASALGLPPARRDLLAQRPGDATLSVFYDAALQSRGWIDPDSAATDRIFREAIDSVTSGRARVAEAVSKMNSGVGDLIK